MYILCYNNCMAISGPSVLTVTQYKANFESLLKNLSDIFLQSYDEIVLFKIVMSLVHLSQGQHARAKDTQATMSRIVKELYDRIAPCLTKDRTSKGSPLEKDSEASPKRNGRGSRRSSRASKKDKEETATAMSAESYTDIECSLSLNLLRLKVLSYRVDISTYFGRDALEDDGNVEDFVNLLMDGMTDRLNVRSNRKNTLDWSSDEKIDAYSTVVIDEGLQVLLTILAWNVSSALKKEPVFIADANDPNMDLIGEIPEGETAVDHFTLRLRNRLIALVIMCFDQFISEDNDESVCAHRINWSHSIQESAGLIACDLRMLFSKEWSDAASPLLRVLSITDDSRLIAGYVRYLRSRSSEMVRLRQSCVCHSL